MDAALATEHNGKYLHNGRPHAVFRAPDSSDAFYQKIDQLLEGRIESEDIRHLAADALSWIFDYVYCVRGHRRADALEVAFTRFTTLAYRMRPRIFNEELNISNGTELARRLGLTRASISQRLGELSRMTGLHLGARTESARAKFRQTQKKIWASGKRPRADKTKPPQRPKPVRR